MRKIVIVLLLMAMLTGCGATQTMETLGNIDHVSPTQPFLRAVALTLPADAAVDTLAGEEGVTVYSCDRYMIVLQTFASGNMAESVRQLSGFTPDALTILESDCQDHKRYDWVWTAAAEEGDMVCRGAILDDGKHHYALCAMAKSQDAGSLQEDWNGLFASFCLESQ